MDFVLFIGFSLPVEVPVEERKREKLIQELFQTEETYLDNLKLVFEVSREQEKSDKLPIASLVSAWNLELGCQCCIFFIVNFLCLKFSYFVFSWGENHFVI